MTDHAREAAEKLFPPDSQPGQARTDYNRHREEVAIPIIQSAIDAATAELKKDAERWRYVRESPMALMTYRGDFWHRESADQEIDAQMKAFAQT